MPIAQDTFQILRVKYENDVQVLFTYLSKDCDFGQLCQLLEDLLQENPSSLIIGDFNFDPSESNILTPFFQQKNFIQLITEPTHEQGRIIDHLYIPRFLSSKIHFEMTYPFFTDHAAIIVKFQNMWNKRIALFIIVVVNFNRGKRTRRNSRYLVLIDDFKQTAEKPT